MMREQEPIFPSLGVVVSGGHTFLVLIEGLHIYKKIGSTVDDAIGEAFDKVAKLLDLPYPGGPEIEKLAKQGDPSLFTFKPGQIKERPYDFSFSGLKTNVFYAIYGQNGTKKGLCPLDPQQKAHVAASFQETALRDIVKKSKQAAKEFGCKAIYIGGGVSQSQKLKDIFYEQIDLPLFFPPKNLSLDNGAMIAGLGFWIYKKKGCSDPWDLEPETRIPFF
jgi:N6-L-threonylcarbamoyladenine synthase